jgi:hypothetical protein
MDHRKNIHGHVVHGDESVEKGFYYLTYEIDSKEAEILFKQAKLHGTAEFQDRENRLFMIAYNRNDSTYRLEGGAYA